MSGVRCRVSGCSSWLGGPGRRVRDLRSKKITFQAGMCMKTKDAVRSPRSEVRSRNASVAGTPALIPLLTPDSCFSRYEGASGDVVENKRRNDPKSEVEIGPAAGAPALTPGSLLLTPAFQEMKVHPEMLLKTKDGKKEGVRYQVSGVRKVSGSAARKNYVPSRNVYENKRTEVRSPKSKGICG